MKRIVFALLLAAALPALAATPLPVRSLAPGELGGLSGMPYLTPANHPFEVAAAARAYAYNKGATGHAVQRKTGSDAAVYRGMPSGNPPLLPPAPASTALLDFITTGDLAQSWATMTASGVPHIAATGYGDFEAEVTASWTTRVTVPSGAAGREVVVRFVIPQASVAGATEQEGQARWRARLRAELLVNGFPAWSTEAIRFTTDPSKIYNNTELLVLQTFGSDLGFPTDDEDLPFLEGGPNNETSASTVNGKSPAKIVHLTLGRFGPGAVIDLSMILRGHALSVPAVSGGTDHRCKSNSVRYFCSRGTVSVDGSSGGEAPRVYLLP